MIDKPMDISEFFHLNSGKWFSQRTSHHLALNKSESGKSDIQIELLDPTAAIVVQLCKDHGIAPNLAILGVQATWTGMMDRETTKKTGSSLVVAIPSTDVPNTGSLLQSQSLVGKLGTSKPAIAQYSLGADQVLTVITETDSFYSDERIWFAGTNLRLRSSKIRRTNGFQTASFCSEIRMGVVPAAAS
jgi:CpeS-like protein